MLKEKAIQFSNRIIDFSIRYAPGVYAGWGMAFGAGTVKEFMDGKYGNGVAGLIITSICLGAAKYSGEQTTQAFNKIIEHTN